MGKCSKSKKAKKSKPKKPKFECAKCGIVVEEKKHACKPEKFSKGKRGQK